MIKRSDLIFFLIYPKSDNELKILIGIIGIMMKINFADFTRWNVVLFQFQRDR